MLKYEIDNQNQSHFDSIIDLNRRIVTPLLFRDPAHYLCPFKYIYIIYKRDTHITSPELSNLPHQVGDSHDLIISTL